MISLIESGNLANTENNPMIPRSAELVGLSTDTKPTGVSVGNGWSFIEMDTGKVFFYNAADEEWLEFAGSGGGGGQGGSNVLVVNMTINGNTATLDKTWKEIYDAPFAVIVSSSGEDDKAYFDIADITYDSDFNTYTVTAVQPGSTYETGLTFSASTETDYPTMNQGQA